MSKIANYHVTSWPGGSRGHIVALAIYIAVSLVQCLGNSCCLAASSCVQNSRPGSCFKRLSTKNTCS